jgi:hypothetical protein
MFDQAGPTIRIASNSEFLHRGFWIESNRPSGSRIRPGFERKSGSSGGAFFRHLSPVLAQLGPVGALRESGHGAGSAPS